MKKKLFAVIATLLIFSAAMVAEETRVINLDARITNSQSGLLSGRKNVTVKLFKEGQETPLWEEVKADVPFNEGLCRISLGDTKSITEVDFSQVSKFVLSIEGEGDIEIQPGVVPFAMSADKADAVDWANVANQPAISDLSGSISAAQIPDNVITVSKINGLDTYLSNASKLGGTSVNIVVDNLNDKSALLWNDTNQEWQVGAIDGVAFSSLDITKEDIIGLGIPSEDTKLSQAQVGTYATNEGFIKEVSNAEVKEAAAIAFSKLNISKADITGLGIPTEDTNTQLSETQVDNFIANNGYLISVSNDNVASDASIAFSKLNITKENIESLGVSGETLSQAQVLQYVTDDGFIKKTDITKNDITGLGIPGEDTNTQLTQIQVGQYAGSEGYIKKADITKNDITALGIPGVDTNTQLSDAEIAALGYVKTDTDTTTTNATKLLQKPVNDAALAINKILKWDGFEWEAADDRILQDSDISNMGYIKVDTKLTDGEIAAMGYIKTDTQLSETQVDSFVANNGYLTEVSNTNVAVDAAIDFSKLNITKANIEGLGIPGADTDTQLNETQVDSFVANNGYLTSVSNTNVAVDAAIDFSKLNITKANIEGLGIPGADTDTQLNETQVDSFVANNGYLTSVSNTNVAVDAAIDFSKLNITKANIEGLGIPGADTNTQLNETQVDGFVANNGYLTEVSNTNVAVDAAIDFSKLNITKANIEGLGIPGADTNTQLNETQVDGFVANNGYLTEVSNTNVAVDAAIDFSKLNITKANIEGLGIPGADTNTQLNETQVDGFVANNGYLTEVSNTNVAVDAAIDFSKLNITKANIEGLGIPGADTTYTAKTNGGLLLTGTEFEIAQNGAANGQVLKWDGTKWTPNNDAGGTTYAAKTNGGLNLDGTEFEIAQNSANSGQALKWDGTKWAPADDTNTQLSENDISTMGFVKSGVNTALTVRNLSMQKDEYLSLSGGSQEAYLKYTDSGVSLVCDEGVLIQNKSNKMFFYAQNGDIEYYVPGGNVTFNVPAGNIFFNTKSGGQTVFAGNREDYIARIENSYQSQDSQSQAGVLALSLTESNINDQNTFVGFFKGENELIGSLSGHSSDAFNFAQTGVKLESAGADYAEYLKRIDPNEDINGGDIVGVYSGKITKKLTGAQRIMVVSSMPIVLGNWRGKGEEHLYEPVAFVGQVPVKVMGKVSAGDYIVPSGKNNGVGVAVSADKLTVNQVAMIVGQAWESSDKMEVKLVNTAITPLDNQAIAIIVKRENADIKAKIQKMEALINKLSK